MTRVIAEAADLSAASLEFASGIGYASTGETLGALVKGTIADHPGAFGAARAAIRERLNQLGGAGSTTGLFLLAGDMATTEALRGTEIDVNARRQLRRLWDDLRHRIH